MRTTLNLDAEILEAARRIAAARNRSVGDVISDLARAGLRRAASADGTRDGFPVFAVPADAPLLTAEDVRRDDDE